LARHSDKILQRFELAPFDLNLVLLVRRFVMPLQFFDDPQAGLDSIINVLRDEDHFLQDFLLEIELGKHVLQFVVQLLELDEKLFSFGFASGLLPLGVFAIHPLVDQARLFD